jgi:hypothetical protein
VVFDQITGKDSGFRLGAKTGIACCHGLHDCSSVRAIAHASRSVIFRVASARRMLSGSVDRSGIGALLGYRHTCRSKASAVRAVYRQRMHW